jgi:hypothetical protein
MSEKDLQKEIDELRAQIKKLQKNHLGLVFEDKKEDVVVQCKQNVPVLKGVKTRRIVTKDCHNNLLIEGGIVLIFKLKKYDFRKSIKK